MPSVTLDARHRGPGGHDPHPSGGAHGCPSHITSTGTRPVRKPSGSATFTWVTPSFAGSPM